MHSLIYFRTKERLCSGEIMVSGDQWPILIYQGYNYDAEDPWNGLFRSSLLVSVSSTNWLRQLFEHYWPRCQGYKHIFTSPSSVEKEPKATRSGNARIHGMTQVTPASIAYVATQVSEYILTYFEPFDTLRVQIRFSLTSSPVFSRTDTVTDSERFYNSILNFFDDVDEKEEVDELLTWWNR